MKNYAIIYIFIKDSGPSFLTNRIFLWQIKA
jgi:hypothetical protein